MASGHDDDETGEHDIGPAPPESPWTFPFRLVLRGSVGCCGIDRVASLPSALRRATHQLFNDPSDGRGRRYLLDVDVRRR